MLFFRFNGLRFRFRDDKEDANNDWHDRKGRYVAHGHGVASFFSPDNDIPDKQKREEYGAFMSFVNSNPNIFKGRHGQICGAPSSNYYFHFIYDAEGAKHKITEWWTIEGHEELINEMDERFRHG